MRNHENQREQKHIEDQSLSAASNTALLIALMLKNLKQRGAAAAIGLGDDRKRQPMEVKIRSGDQTIYQAKEGSPPTINTIKESDIDYLRRAIATPEGTHDFQLNRDVTITINNHEVFRVRDGTVELNLLAEQPEKSPINLDIIQPQAEAGTSPNGTEPTQADQQAQPAPTAAKEKSPIKAKPNQKSAAPSPQPQQSPDVFSDIDAINNVRTILRNQNANTIDHDGSEHRLERFANGNIKVTSKTDNRGVILETKNGQIVSNLTPADHESIQRLSMDIDFDTEALGKEQDQQLQAGDQDLEL